MYRRLELLVLIGCAFAILVESVSDTPRIPITESENKPPDDEKAISNKLNIARHSLLERGNGRTEKDLDDIQKALKDLGLKDIVGPVGNEESLSALKRLPRYDVIAGAPKKLSVINRNLRDYLFQTDILASAEDIRELTASHETRQKRKATNVPKEKWPVREKGVIPYSLDDSLSTYKKGVIAKSIKFWEENSCVKFQLNGEETVKASINFYSGDGCYSIVGKYGPNQDLSIGDGCEYFGIVTHEIAHALGFYHEQERYDRSDHVEVIFRNIAPSDRIQFQLVKAMNLYGIPYDYGSVMHYESDAFAVNPRLPTIRSLNPEYQQTMGQGRGPSFLDVLEMNRHYECIDACRNSTVQCQNGGYPNPKNCRICNCPAGFGGRLCEGLQPSTKTRNCGGILNAEQEWHTLSVSLGTKSLTDEAPTCYWHIKAPTSISIQVKITRLLATCDAGCFYAALELKTDAQFVQSGHVHCCVTDDLNRIYESKTNLVPVIAYADRTLSFTIQYRQASNTTFSPAEATTPSEATTPFEATPPAEDATTSEAPSDDAILKEATTPSVEIPAAEAVTSTDIPCAENGTWSTWSPEISPKDCCGFCSLTRRRKCESEELGCPCNGADIERIDCNNNIPCPAKPGPECCSPWTKAVKNGTDVCELKFS